MNKIFKMVVLIIFGLFLVSCEENNEPTPIDNPPVQDDPIYHIVTFDYNYNNEVYDVDVIDGDLVPSIFIYDYVDNMKFVGWSLTNSEDDLYDMSIPVTTDIKLYAVWVEYLVDYTYFMEDYVPYEILDDIELPQQIGEVMLMWNTSDLSILSKTGQVSIPRKDTTLTVYLTVYDNGILSDYEKEVIVRGMNLAPLKVEDIAVGYYSVWNFFGYTDEMLDSCDVINLCFAYVSDNYTLDYKSVSSVLNQVTKAHNKGVRVLLSVQGYSSEGANFSKAASTASGRSTLANSMLNICKKYNLDGIDIDWEYPGYNTGKSTSVDKQNYTLLMQTIYSTLKAEDETYLLSAAIPGGPYTVTRFDLTSVSKYLDYICVMTYDLNTSNATHHTALYSSSGTANGCSVDETVKYYLNYNVPARKIVIGMAFYGKYTTATALGGSGNGMKSITYTKIKENYLSRLGKDVFYYYDTVAKAPYLLDTTNKIFITYDDETSIKEKCEYAKAKKLGGVMIWELGEDSTNTLIKAVKDNM